MRCRITIAAIGLWCAWPASAEVPPLPVVLQTPAEAIGGDAIEYARQYGVTLIEAIRRLRAQEASVARTDALQAIYRDRLAGLFIEHRPVFRIVISLTGTAPVVDEAIVVEGVSIPVVFRTGAPASRDAILAAIDAHQAEIRAAVVDPPGMGVDPRSGTLAVIVRAQEADDPQALEARLSDIAGVPVRVRTWASADGNLSIAGGGRVTGADPDAGRRYSCTTGFVVTDGSRTGITTAAHCPDALSYVERGAPATPLTLVGAWGARYQDVQIHVGGDVLPPLFHADGAKATLRPLTSWRNRSGTRVGDFVCHRGERTGYSCAEVEFVDYAPPGDLCAGPCAPSWVAVKGPACRSGDSGGPVFLGTIAFGIVKGGSYAADGTCRLYYYMSTDYLPPGWTLLHQ